MAQTPLPRLARSTRRSTQSVTAWNRFWIGGLGALLPLLVTLLAIDVAALWDQRASLSNGILVGAVVRYLVLFALGGIVAALNSDEVKPIKLVQLGIAAPAVISSFINAQTPNLPQPAAPAHAAFSPLNIFIDPAWASAAPRRADHPVGVQPASFFKDVVTGATSNLNATAQQRRVNQEFEQRQQQHQQQQHEIRQLRQQLQQLQQR